MNVNCVRFARDLNVDKLQLIANQYTPPPPVNGVMMASRAVEHVNPHLVDLTPYMTKLRCSLAEKKIKF